MNKEMTKFAAVTDAAKKIRAILNGCMIGGVIEQAIGKIIYETAESMGGGVTALLQVTEALSKEVPVGARRLRLNYNEFKRLRILNLAAAKLFEYVHGGDVEADSVEIGCRILETFKVLGEGFNERVVLMDLAAKLDVSPRVLAKCRDVYLVAELGGLDLKRLYPLGCPAHILMQFTKFLKIGLMPWQKRALLITAAKRIARHEMESIRAVKVVSEVIKMGPPTAKTSIRPNWHHPSKPSHNQAA